ncbi:DUF523 and DUF1722 domain-containing protein [bacterium]|nr:DUF523 and DUF1722 domain-containing protein [bacterium]
MDHFSRPRIVISKCLGFEACRYNGDILPDRFVDKLKLFVEFLPVCPEEACQFGVPRDPIWIVMQSGKRCLYQPATGRDVTSVMLSFIDEYLGALHDIDGFILKSRSPSCGLYDVKIFLNKSGTSQSSQGTGFFAQGVLNAFPDYPAEDEERLQNCKLRDDFLTALFTLARFRNIQAGQNMGALIKFHARHKYLLMAYNEKQTRILGKITANSKKKKAGEVLKAYQGHLGKVFSRPVQAGAMINALMHGFGGISNQLSSEERQYFLMKIEEYRNERIPRSVLLNLLQSWSMRFQNHYLLNQRLFHPYPLELIEFTI